jgi:uncharacterized protein YegP (UPF0339 family)
MAEGFSIEVYRDLAGEYRWRIIAGNGRIVATSGEAFDSKSNAKRAAVNVAERIGENPEIQVFEAPEREVR